MVTKRKRGPEPGPEPGPGRWLSIQQIAEDLGISVHTAYKWSARGGPYFPRTIRLRNGNIRVRRDWYEAWLAELEPDRGRD
jgi:predicted DNA-binding transcriptional regulator AlpA